MTIRWTFLKTRLDGIRPRQNRRLKNLGRPCSQKKRPPCGTHFEASCLGVAPAFGSIFSKVVETTPQPCSPEMEEEYPYRGSGTSG